MDRIHGAPITVRVFEPAEEGVDRIRGLRFSNVICRHWGECCFRGAKTRPLEDFSFDNCRFVRDPAAIAPWEDGDARRKAAPDGGNPLRHCRGFTFSGTTLDM